MRTVPLVFLLVALGCDRPGREPPGERPSLLIVSGSENETLQPLIQEWARDRGVDIQLKYQGSIDISRSLQLPPDSIPFDVVWPANSMWIHLGDVNHVVRDAKSIMRSPVVFGVKTSIATKLGWVNNTNVTVQDILAAGESGALGKLGMTSATQSNSGATAYLGFLYAMAGNPDVLQSEHLRDSRVQDKVRQLLRTVDRSAGSSGWLKKALVENPDQFDAMVNYEAMVIEANNGWEEDGAHVNGLIARGREPLYVVYPANGLTIADSPLGFIDHGSPEKRALFDELQAYLLSNKTQLRIVELGRRAGQLGLDIRNPDPQVWNSAWGIDVRRDISPVPVPEAGVIREALTLYQVGLRKPSLTIWVVDVSGSMGSNGGIEGLRSAFSHLLDPVTAEKNLLQTGPRDVTMVIPFSSRVHQPWKVSGNTPDQLRDLLRKTSAMEASGNTAMYDGLVRGLEEIAQAMENRTIDDFLPAIVIMSDGATNAGLNFDQFAEKARTDFRFISDIPIHTIGFGEGADVEALKELSRMSAGRFFDSKGDLVNTLRQVKGYN